MALDSNLAVSPEVVKIEKRYQIIRTLINLVAIILLIIVLHNQDKIINSNHTALEQLKTIGFNNRTLNQQNSRHINCIVELFLKESPPTAADIENCK